MEIIKLIVFLVILLASIYFIAKKFKRMSASLICVCVIVFLYWLFYFSGVIP